MQNTTSLLINRNNRPNFFTFLKINIPYDQCGIRGREEERQPHNHEVPRSIVRSRCRLGPCPPIRRVYFCSSQEAESKDISVSCKDLFLN